MGQTWGMSAGVIFESSKDQGVFMATLRVHSSNREVFQQQAAGEAFAFHALFLAKKLDHEGEHRQASTRRSSKDV